MNRHICVLICYKNFEHIKKCFESLYNDEIDFFIVENYSENSEEIQDFFLKENVVGYIQFEKNITNNALSIFVKDYENILNKYEYVTFSDCDLIIENSKDTFNEIIKNLSLKNVFVSCVDLKMDNLPNVKGSESWVPPALRITDEYIEGACGVHLMTLRGENLWLVKNTNFLDSVLRGKVNSEKKKWVKTLINKAYHLTWDLYFNGSDYFEYKKSSGNLWSHNNTCDYKKII